MGTYVTVTRQDIGRGGDLRRARGAGAEWSAGFGGRIERGCAARAARRGEGIQGGSPPSTGTGSRRSRPRMSVAPASIWDVGQFAMEGT